MNAEEKALRASVRRFMDTEVLPYLDEWERDGELPRELHEKAGKLGLLGVGFPAEVGGRRRFAAGCDRGAWRRCTTRVDPAVWSRRC